MFSGTNLWIRLLASSSLSTPCHSLSLRYITFTSSFIIMILFELTLNNAFLVTLILDIASSSEDRIIATLRFPLLIPFCLSLSTYLLLSIGAAVFLSPRCSSLPYRHQVMELSILVFPTPFEPKTICISFALFVLTKLYSAC